MTPQEIFNKAYLGVTAQGGASVGRLGCAYRSVMDGQVRACGVGHLVDDELAAKMDKAQNFGSEGTAFRMILDAAGAGDLSFDIPQFLSENRELLEEIQNAHDFPYAEASNKYREDRKEADAYFMEGFKRRMRRVAHNYDLTVPEVPQ